MMTTKSELKRKN